MKIFAVVVTYTRLALLKKVIDLLKRQTRQLDSIVIVNNGSTDGTKEWLEREKNITLINQSNSGGAGGFETGVKYAYENEADWIWMMDDDVFPNIDCLEKLLGWTSISQCIQPRRYYSDDVEVNFEQWLDPITYSKFGYWQEKSFNNGKKFCAINVGCFEGMFVSKGIVNKIGFPDKRFFIAEDDTIYGFAASFYTNVILVSDAIMVRARRSSDRSVSPMYTYYACRNFHLVYESLNLLLDKKNSFLYVKYIYQITHQVYLSIFLYDNKMKHLISVFRGFYDCFRKRNGATY